MGGNVRDSGREKRKKKREKIKQEYTPIVIWVKNDNIQKVKNLTIQKLKKLPSVKVIEKNKLTPNTEISIKEESNNKNIKTEEYNPLIIWIKTDENLENIKKWIIKELNNLPTVKTFHRI